MRAATLATAIVLATMLAACGGTDDDNEAEQPCQTDAPAAACMDKAPTEPRRIAAQ